MSVRFAHGARKLAGVPAFGRQVMSRRVPRSPRGVPRRGSFHSLEFAEGVRFAHGFFGAQISRILLFTHFISRMRLASSGEDAEN